MRRSLLIPVSLALLALGLLSSCDSDKATNSDDGGGATTAIVSAPTFSPAGGTYTTAQTVTIASATSGATIYYTTTGATPTTSSTKYTSSVAVSASKTLKAIAVKDGMTTSSVGSASYTIQSGSGTTRPIPWNTSISYGTLTDTRDGQVYKTVKIGTQTWMAENLSFKVDSSWCYENSLDSCSKYGREYQWAAAMGLDTSYNRKRWHATLPHQGVCPSGWHIPSGAEWYELETYVVADSAGTRLRSTSGLNSAYSRYPGTDAYGFRAIRLPGRTGAFFWSLSKYSEKLESIVQFYEDSYRVGGSQGSKKSRYSIRCLENATNNRSDSFHAPTFRPQGGVYFGTQSVMLSSTTSEEIIYYTTNGSIPTTSSTKYTGAFAVGSSQTIRSIAVRNGKSSAASSATFTIITDESASRTIPWNSTITYGTLTDARDGQVYMTVNIGTQNWMAQNLNYIVDSSWCYQNSEDSCGKYGRVYQWASVMGLDNSYNKHTWGGTLPSKGVCPSGWHVPSEPEWTELIYTVSRKFGAPNQVAVNQVLKSISGWQYNLGTDDYGFRVVPAGSRNFKGTNEVVGLVAIFWSSSDGVNSSWCRKFEEIAVEVKSEDRYDKSNAFSLRCLQD